MSERTDVVKKDQSIPEKNPEIPAVVPLVDIYENDEEILLRSDMPGVEKKDISLNIDNGKLSLVGIRRFKSRGSAQWEEFGDVEYQRTFSVPQAIDTEKIVAELKDGVLSLHLPKSERAKPRQIEIKAA